MKRRQFIKTTLASGLALSIAPQLAFQSHSSSINYEELIGKGNPDLLGEGFQLRKEAHDAFVRLKTEALKSDIHIQIVSSYRSFDHQNRIWERKYNRNINTGLTPQESIKKIIEYSTIPGTSRHHWATDIDIIDANVSQPSSVLQPRHFDGNGCFRKLKLWMNHNANAFGFHLVYTNQQNRKGFKYEPWHYSYKPLSSHYLTQYKNLNIKNIITNEDLLGNKFFSEEFISKYLNENVLDINPELL
ncbi:M15 family metallopeptidase [Psychroserpens ponticola]|uniref:M15 family metallopeptidase n=1 Tax=Psychroserpens ponticola TaxID=2932268 RepID=A0ABY7RVA2_9FLAO|nr:M15 family metallopeptidase [Psychroserpens ponticola]WCO01058.1 M15 family metallopeptidase [Psychroserpens ponticola]